MGGKGVLGGQVKLGNNGTPTVRCAALYTSTMNSAKRVGTHVTMLPNLQLQLCYCSEARARGTRTMVTRAVMTARRTSASLADSP